MLNVELAGWHRAAASRVKQSAELLARNRNRNRKPDPAMTALRNGWLARDEELRRAHPTWKPHTRAAQIAKDTGATQKPDTIYRALKKMREGAEKSD